MRTKYRILLIVAPAVFVLDQLTKWAVARSIPVGARVPVIPGFFDLSHYYNPGAAFGMFGGLGADFRVPFFYIISAIATLLLVVFFVRLGERERLMPVALALVLGGIAGNLVDRIRFGEVLDFLSVHIGDRVLEWDLFGRHFSVLLEWPAFNVADSAITVAMVLIVYSALFGKGAEGR